MPRTNDMEREMNEQSGNSGQLAPDAGSGGDASSEYVMIPKKALNWLHGREGEFACPPDLYHRGAIPSYWWRREFDRRCAAIAARQPVGFDFLTHLQRQREWSERTFGPGDRAVGVVDHIRKELREIESDPGDLAEWIDVAILALDGAWRSGASAEQIIAALVAKQTRNEGRTWPDWRTADPTKAIEHDRSGEAPPALGKQACGEGITAARAAHPQPVGVDNG